MKTLKQLIEAKIEREAVIYEPQDMCGIRTDFKAGAYTMLPQLLELADTLKSIAAETLSEEQLNDLSEVTQEDTRIARNALANLEKWAAEGSCEGTDT